MELRELIRKLPPRANVVVLTSDDGAIAITPEQFDKMREDLTVLRYQHSEVKHLEYNMRCCAYQVAVEQATLNIDKLTELYPYVDVKSVSDSLTCLGFDGGTTLTNKWLYSPYNEEEGKEED